MTAATIVQLYPNELGGAGDRGNVLALGTRLTAAGIESTVVEHHRGDVLPAATDLVVIGNGPLSAMRNVHGDLLANGDRLREWAAAGVPIFAHGAGAELLGTGIDLLNGSSLAGLGIFPFTTARVTDRKVGYIRTKTDWGQLVGFEDNASVWKLDDGARPLGTVIAGSGNGDGREGVVIGSSIATQIGGPVLPLNPLLTGVLVAAVASRLGAEVVASAPTELDDFARKARDIIIANAGHVFSRI